MADIELQLQAQIDNLRESLSVEVKNWLNGLAANADKANLAKEIIALANHGGGFVFIGFEDAEPHATIQPAAGQLEAFGQDAIAGIVNSYINPPFQCDVHFLRRQGEEVSHPVIVVPGGHRTPVFARRGGPNNEIVQTHDVYLRRPGGASEAARTQDDWEKLLDRLVKARQADQLDAIRGILNPQPLAPAQDRQAELAEWTQSSLERWQARLAGLPADDGRRFLRGYWYTSFRVSPFNPPNLVALSEMLDRRAPKLSGWPPFTFLHVEGRRPAPIGDTIEAWLGPNDNGDRSDFWRVSRHGFCFMLRPMQEDREGYGQGHFPPPPNPAFDWVLPMYRMTEVFHFLRAIAGEFSEENATYDLLVHYHGTAGRCLWRNDHRYWLETSGPCHVDDVSGQSSGNVSELEFNLNEHLWRLLVPIYEQFDFTVLERALVDRVVQEAQENLRR
jgi:hypothetical protein